MAGWGFVGLFTQAINAFMFHNTIDASASALRWCDLCECDDLFLIFENLSALSLQFDTAAAITYAYPFGYSAGSLALLRKLEKIACELRHERLHFLAPDKEDCSYSTGFTK